MIPAARRTLRMSLEIRNNRDLLAGLFFIVIGAAAMYIASGYRFGTTTQMGPGYFPILLAIALILLGAVVSIRGLRMREQITVSWSPRAMIVLTLVIILFAVLMPFAGFVPAVAALVAASSAASSEFKFREMVILAVIVTSLTTGLIVFALGLPYPLFGSR
jgi:hypothetical protein